MAKKEKLKVMVASSVYGFEDTIEQVCGLLKGWGYHVLNSHINTIPTDSDDTNIEDCLNAVRECDFFIGIVRSNMGTGNINGKNITFEEMRTAIELNKKRWFAVEKSVEIARQVTRHIILTEDKDKDKQRNAFESKIVTLKKSDFLDPLSIEALNMILAGKENDDGDIVGRWCIPFERPSQIYDYIKTNFGDYNKMLKKKEAQTNE